MRSIASRIGSTMPIHRRFARGRELINTMVPTTISTLNTTLSTAVITVASNGGGAAPTAEYSAPVKKFNSDLLSQRPEKNRYPAEFSGALLHAIALGLEKAVS